MWRRAERRDVEGLDQLQKRLTVVGRGDLAGGGGQHQLVARQLALVAQPGGGPPQHRVEPVDGQQQCDDAVDGHIASADMREFMQQDEAQFIGAQVGQQRLRQQDRLSLSELASTTISSSTSCWTKQIYKLTKAVRRWGEPVLWNCSASISVCSPIRSISEAIRTPLLSRWNLPC